MGLSAETSSVDSNASCEAVSPLSQKFRIPLLSLCVQAIFELEGAIDVSSAKQAITNTLLPGNPRFPSKMSFLRAKLNSTDYISTIHLTPLPKCRPMWAFHILNYNTSKARSTLIINMHHSLGDGTSLMSLLLCCVTRADDPNLPVTFPSFMKSPPRKIVDPYHSSSWVSIQFMYFMLHTLLFMPVLVMWCTLCDLISSFLRIIWTDDSKLPFRGPPGVEMLPKVISTVTFLMEDVKKIKNSVGGTVNDVVMGVIFAGLQRYLETTLSHGEVAKVGKEMAKSRVTGIVFMNTRALSGLKDIKEMLKLKSKAPWGNHIGMLQIPIPVTNEESPLGFMRRAKKIIDRKKMSLEVFITRKLFSYLPSKASATGIYNTLANTTLALSNMIGPTNKIALIQIPVKSISFLASGILQTLLLTVVSYMGSVRLEVIGTKNYVNSDTLAKCFTECFDKMMDAIEGNIVGS